MNKKSPEYRQYLQTMKSVQRRLTETAAMRQDPAVARVFGFLSSIGLLQAAERYPGGKNSKHSVAAVLRAAEIEPRVMEVLPAAMYAYPRSFLHQDLLPGKLKEIIAALHAGRDLDAEYGGITFQQMKRWLSFKLPDKRTKPMGTKKILCSFPLHPEVCARLRSYAQKHGISQAKAIELAIAGLGESPTGPKGSN